MGSQYIYVEGRDWRLQSRPSTVPVAAAGSRPGNPSRGHPISLDRQTVVRSWVFFFLPALTFQLLDGVGERLMFATQTLLLFQVFHLRQKSRYAFVDFTGCEEK